MTSKRWVRLLAYATGSVNQELLLQNEYLAVENQGLPRKSRPWWCAWRGRTPAGPIKCHQRLGGLLKFYQRAA
jgi:hypothetical protein